MDFSGIGARETYELYNKEKVITGIKNNNLEVKFMTFSYLWLIPLCLIIGFCRYIGIFLNSKNSFEFYIVATIVFTIFIIGLLSRWYKLYFYNDKLILKNKLNKKIVIDVNRYPRIYIRQQVHKRYNYVTERYVDTTRYILYIEQDDKDISLDIQAVGNKKIREFLESIETKEEKDVGNYKWMESENNKEKIFSNYIDLLIKKEKIVGVKDCTKIIKIKNNTNKNLKKKIAIITAIAIISFMCNYIVNLLFDISITSIFYNAFLFIGSFALVIDFLFFIQWVDEKASVKSSKISFPSDESIKINRTILNYKESKIMIEIIPIQSSYSTEKYTYMVAFIKNNDTTPVKSIDVNDEIKLGEFIDNLIFEPKTEY